MFKINYRSRVTADIQKSTTLEYTNSLQNDFNVTYRT